MNLLNETRDILVSNNKTFDDVLFVGDEATHSKMTVKEFLEHANVEYDSGYGIEVINTSEINKEAVLSYAAVHCGLTQEMVDTYKDYPTSVWEFATDKQKEPIHPTQKPIDLCRYAIRTYTNEGDTVLDCCCVSGSIPLAAMLEGRNYIGMDNGSCDKKNSKYFGCSWADVATDRIANYKEQKVN